MYFMGFAAPPSAVSAVPPSLASTEPSELKSRPSRMLRPSIRGDHGGALVEMALVMPIMLAMLTSIFSFSVVLYQKLQLGEAVSNAGRVMALERGDTDPCATTANAIYAAAPALAKSSMTLTFTLGGSNSGGSVSGGTSYGGTKGTAPSCVAAGNGGSAALQSGWPAQIQATYPCSFFVYNTKLGACSVTTQVTEVIQ